MFSLMQEENVWLVWQDVVVTSVHDGQVGQVGQVVEVVELSQGEQYVELEHVGQAGQVTVVVLLAHVVHWGQDGHVLDVAWLTCFWL